ncbi:MAG: hypothetical protein NC548_31100 [Lachnospiraceae bacterium]|nr:hypothetical protein [Lachnospiraceae bacterium]MCM1232058.1 hypothetical protein [Ruminococcus flavefaciens]
MKATTYRNLSNRKEIVQVVAGQSVSAAFPQINFENAVAIVNGKEVTADYMLNEHDVLTIRELPAGVTAAIVAMVAVVVAVGVVGGIQLYKAKRAAEEAQEELEKIKKQTNRDDIDNRPFLRGASNTAAKEKSQPYICGRHLFTPYLLCSPFYRLFGEDGKDQYTYMVLECGFNRQVFDSVSIDDVTIKKFGDTEPQEGAYDLDGGQVFADEGLIEIAQDGELLTEIPELNYKTVSTACNDEIPRDSKVEKGDAEYLTYTLDANALNVEVAISFPYGLYAYNDNGDKMTTKVTITPQYSTDGGNSWTDLRFTTGNTFNRNVSSKELRFRAVKKFSLDDYRNLQAHKQSNILLRVRSDGNDDSKIKNDCYILYYQSQCFDPNKSSEPAGVLKDDKAGLVPCKIVEDRERAFCTIMGLRVKASKNNEDKLRKINIITRGTARTWNGSKWSDAKSATRNAAAWALEILTSESHPMSRFSDDEIDLESFGEFYEWCEKNEFYFDYVITQGRKKGDTLNLILGNCGAALYLDLYGRLAVATDRPQENAIAVYNPQNIISISNKKTFGRRTDGVRVKYISSRDDLYSEDTYLLMREKDGKPLELNADSAIKDVTVTGITEYGHVVKYARRLMAMEALRPKTTTIEVGNEGIYFTPYSKILLQDDSLKIGTGSGVIKATQWIDGRLAKIFLDSYVTFESGKQYGIIINCFGDKMAIPLPLKVSGEGYTDTLTVESPLSDTAKTVPELGCVASFGELDRSGNFDRITTPYLINNITRSDKGFRLELVNYDEAIYRTGTIPDYQSNITQKPSASNASIPPDFVTKDEMMDAIVNGIDKNSEPPDTPIVEQSKAYRDYVSMNFGDLPDGTRNELKEVEWQVNKGTAWEIFSTTLSFYARYEFARETDGYPEAEDLNWQFRCRVTNIAGKKSEWSAPATADVSGYGSWLTPSAKDVAAKAEYGGYGIRVQIKTVHENGGRGYYGRTEYDIEAKYNGTTIKTERSTSEYFVYYFDRETDGYPERHGNAADGIRDLSLYSFTATPVDTVTGRKGGSATSGQIDDSEYGTWLVPELNATATAGEHRISLIWTLASHDNAYGNITYDVYLDGNAIAEGISRTSLVYAFHENLEKEDLEKLSFSIRARNEAHERTEKVEVNTSGYLGYRIEKPEIAAKAVKDGIEIEWKRTNDFYGKLEYVLLKDGVEAFRSESETSFFLKFGEGEFPEKADIERIVLQVRIDGEEDSVTSDAAEIDTEGYLTYVPSVPTVYPSASGRNANLSWDTQGGVYGFLGCEIQIAKAYRTAGGKCEPITDDAELEWFAPALGLNPYASLDNYKKGEAGGRLEVRGTSVSFSLPLFGQDADGAEDTQYAFRLRGKSAAGKVSDWTEALYLTCRAISAHDVVRAWDLGDGGEKVKLDGALGAKQIFVEELAAISANLGYITDGALRGNAYNYWAVSDTPMEDGSLLRRGSFRVGGKDQYILVEPRLGDSGEPTGEYDITFVVGNYSVSASGTQIRGGAFEVYDTKGNLMFSVSPDGIAARVMEGTFVQKGSQFLVGPNVMKYPYELFVMTDAGVYSLVYGVNDNPESMTDYYTDVYKVEYGGSPERKFVGRIAGSPGSDNPAEYFAGYIANTIIYVLYSMCRGWAKADGGTVVFPYPCPGKAGDEIDDADMMYGEWTIDLAAARIRFEHKYDSFDYSIGQNSIYASYLDGNIFFVTQNEEYDSNLGKYLRSMGLQFLKGNAVVRLAPSVSLDNSGRVVGFTMDGDTAYAAFGFWLFTAVVRYDTKTGAAEAFLFYGSVPKYLETAEDSLPSALMVDDEFITLTGSFDLPESTDTSSGSLVHRVFNNCVIRIRRDGIAWTGIDLGALGDDGSAWSSALANCEPISGIRVYVSDFDDVSGDENNVIRYLSNFARYGMLCMCRLSVSDDIIRLQLLRAELEDGDEDARGLFTVAGRFRTEVAKEFELYMSDENGVDYLTYGMITAIVSDGVFPGKFFGVDCALAQTFAQAGEVDYASYLGIYALEDGGDASGESVRKAGAGFVRVSRDRFSGKTRYYLDTGEWLEFDRDGRLAAAKGDKGDPGDKGEKGDKGEPATTSNVWPVGSVWVTDDSSLNASAMFGGSWNKTNVIIGFKTWYYWKRNS